MNLKVKDIECQVIRSSNRKTVGIYVERDGQVVLRVPLDAPTDKLTKVVAKKLPWIYKHLALWQELNANTPQREFVSGETFYVGGQACLLDVRSDTAVPLYRDGDRLVLNRAHVSKADELLRAMYRREGYEQLPKLIERYSPRMGVSPGKLKVWELKNRWASCSVAGNLNFHWRVLALPLDIQEYLVVHELAHLKFSNHGKEFWGVVDKTMPKWKAAAEWLRVNGLGRSF
jgi:predicted metal-dependent hydrolase